MVKKKTKEPLPIEHPTLTEMLYHMMKVSTRTLDIGLVSRVLYGMSQQAEAPKCLKSLDWYFIGEQPRSLDIDDLFSFIGAIHQNPYTRG